MESLFQELKRAREAKRLSIVDVSDATLINATFLEAIEQGNTNILPQTYVRAFIREYASFVGLDPVEIMKRYDLAQNETAPPKDQTPAPLPTPKQDIVPTVDKVAEPPVSSVVRAKVAIPAILTLILIVIVWNLTRTKTPSETKEIPIEHVTMDSTRSTDSTTKSVASPRKIAPSPKDSLTLQAIAKDSVWVEVIVDSLPPRQYIFAPNRKISWKANQGFRINVGNAGLIELTLNGKPLGTPGKRGAVMRNVAYNRQTLLHK